MINALFWIAVGFALGVYRKEIVAFAQDLIARIKH